MTFCILRDKYLTMLLTSTPKLDIIIIDMDKQDNIKAWLLGLGFDCKDGHLRITHGKNYRLYGGSEDTHNVMFEKVTKFNEQLDKKGKKLENITEHEFYDIANNVELKVTDPNRN